MSDYDYIKDRLDDQMQWYSKKSQLNQKKYKSLSIIKIALAVSIPVLSAFLVQHNWINYLIAVIGGLIAFLEGITRVYNYKELWTKYRITSELLKREKILYTTKTLPYDQTSSINDLIVRCEDIMGNENFSWIQLQNKNNNNA